MSLEVVKCGLMDTLQDTGRYGYQHLGINPTGAMDKVAMQTANMLVGNKQHEAILEMHFPAATIRFKHPAIIAIAGADFTAYLDDLPFGINRLAAVQAGCVLRFIKRVAGARVYLAVQGGFDADTWLNSKSTHLKIGTGGLKGRALNNGDLLKCRFKMQDYSTQTRVYSWVANTSQFYNNHRIRVLPGAEYALLAPDVQALLTTQQFNITEQSDRMVIVCKAEV